MAWLFALGVLALAIYSARFRKVLGVLLVVGLVGGVAFWKWEERKTERTWYTPTKQTTLKGVSLGMHREDVVLQKGKPTTEDTENESAFWSDVGWIYFEKDKVIRVCTSERYGYDVFGNHTMLNYKVGSSLKDLDRLGPQFHRSLSADGLREARTWTDYGVSFMLEKGTVITLCVTEGPVRFIEERRHEGPPRTITVVGKPATIREVGGEFRADECWEPSEKKFKPSGTCSWQQKDAKVQPASSTK